MKKLLLLAAIAAFSLLVAPAANAQVPNPAGTPPFASTHHAGANPLAGTNPLANTKWKGTIRLPMEDGTLQPVGIMWDFQPDTATILYDNGMQPDVMVYKVDADKNTLTFRKVSGGVPCDTVALLTVSYQIKNDQLSLKMIQDDCKPRSHADASQPFERVR